MARTPSFNFGANRKPRRGKSGKKSGKASKSKAGKSNAWRAYVGSNAPIPA
jgi:hypothetical protein